MRSRKGQSLVELAAGLIVAVPILLCLLDCGVLLIGAAANDSLCRDAARAAASGPPSDETPGERTVSGAGVPRLRAKQVIYKIYKLGIPVTVNESELLVKEKIDSVVGGSINGSVTVRCTVDVNPPFILGVVTKSKIALSSSHNYPYTYVPAVAVAEP